MTAKKRLLIIGPSFRRKKTDVVLGAIERYDGLFFRIARKYLSQAKDVQVVVMIDDLTLVNASTPLPNIIPEGASWGEKKILHDIAENTVQRNGVFLERKLRNRNYSEVFISMGKKYAVAIPDVTQYGVNVIFPASGGLGPKAQALKKWLSPEIKNT